MRPAPSQRLNALALLRTCRQIYRETSEIPYTVSTFTGHCFGLSTRHFKKLRRHQLRQISEFRLLVFNLALIVPWPPHDRAYLQKLNMKVLPCLKRLKIYVVSSESTDDQTLEACEAYLRSNYESDLKITGVEVTIEKVDFTWRGYNKK
jgi:hypothetical protein